MATEESDAATALDHLDPAVRELIHLEVEDGVLIPLKTTLELRDEYPTGHVLITRAPVKCANPVLIMLRDLLSEEIVKGFPHLRRCSKPIDLPSHLRTEFMNESPEGRAIHTGKSTWIYIILGLEASLSKEELEEALRQVEGMEGEIFFRSIPVPLVSPTSQMQAALWSQQFWPTLYRKNNPLGPHPSMVARYTDELSKDAAIWMTLAHQVARQGKDAGLGEPIGACIVQREEGNTTLVALACDVRSPQDQDIGETGNPLAHSVMRAISQVAQKLVRVEENRTRAILPRILEFEAFQDMAILQDEKTVFAMEHPNPDGYLCHGLELYLTHEPCVMCSMAILHSRVGKVIFRSRMPLTGGMCAEHRGTHEGQESGNGLGLFWRRELNWSLIAWEWESSGCLPQLPVDGHTHV